MSPVASGGPPHTRASSINGGGPIGTTNGVRMDGIKGANRVFPHLDDLVAVKPDVDVNSPIRKILQDGELLAKQADTHLDFRRPDIALQEYVKASIVTIEIIPRHKDYPMIQSDRGELHRQYAGLTKRINAQHPKFAEVKKTIQENNARSGVKPSGGRLSGFESGPKPNGTANGHSRAQSVQHPPVNGLTNGTAPRKKPPIQPKPDALHGNAIHSTNQPASETDLAARFARLRSAESNGVVQDPRIRTQSISIPDSSGLNTASAASSGNYATINRQFGPREMPSVPTTVPRTTKLPLDVQIPGLPRPPDAIYSPARNPDNAAAANLPSSVPRSTSYLGNSRQGAAPPISTVGPTPGVLDNRQDYFSPAHSVETGTYSQKKRQVPDLPDSTTVSAEELMGYLKIGSHTLRVLLVDVRSREDFENGHIMSQSIICVEPITLREGISAEQLGDSMIIAPDIEQSLYDQRQEFDLIVFYDQSSSSIKSSGLSGSDGALNHFARAVYEYDYEKRLKRRPMLLVGGLDAWIDLLGPNSLKASISRTSSPGPMAKSSQKSSRPLSRAPPARNPPNIPMKRRKTHSSRPLSKEEETIWDQTLREDSALRSPAGHEGSNSDDLVYAKTTEDFFRRYPELPPIQESMTSPPPARPSPNNFYEDLVPSVPPPPARPAPALPRQRSSGLSEKGPTVTYAHNQGWGNEHQTITPTRVARGLTGLANPGVHCYMNSAIQALSSTPWLRELLINFQYPPETPLPRKAGETTTPPQLLVRSLGNLLGHVWNGAYDWVTPKTFARYVNTVHAGKMTDSKVRELAYGGRSRQHDSAEFLNFLLEILDDELNPKRDQPAPNTSSPEYERTVNELPIAKASAHVWETWVSGEDSPITRKMKGQIGHITTCDECRKESRTFDTFTYLTLNILKTNTQSVEDMIRREWNNVTTISNYSCDHCKRKDVSASRVDYLCWLPDYLILQISRYNNSLDKIQTSVTFPEKGLDLEPAFLPRNTDDPLSTDHRRKRPFLYDCYAAILHQGYQISSGHYWTVAKSTDKYGQQAGDWQKFNDSLVAKTTFAELQSRNTTVIFLKRQGAPDF